MPKPLRIRIIYEGKVADVTGINTEEAIVSEGFVFIELLQQIFLSHPEIEPTFAPGQLGLVLNGNPPSVQHVLCDHDEVILTSAKSSVRVS